MAAQEGTEPSGGVKPFLFVDHTRLLQTSLARYFNKPLFSDITVIGPDGRKLLCHQVVLSAGSKRFANMLEQGNLANEELPVWGVDSDALQAIIEFFYSGQCNLGFPSAVAVMDAANRLDVPSLSAAANTYVREALSPQTASTILMHSLQFKLVDLSNSCLAVIKDSFSTVTASKDFAQASFDTLKRILTHVQGTQGASDEDLFRAAWHWTLAEPSRSSMFDACVKIVPIPPTLSVKELIEASNPQGAGGMGAVAALLQAAAAAQEQQGQKAGGSGGDNAGAGATGRDGSQQPTSQRQDAAPAAAAGAVRAEHLTVDVGVVVKEERGAASGGPLSSAHNTTSAAPQGTLSSFDPVSGQPTPTSKALTGPLEGAMFGAAGGPADMAAAAAAAAAAGLDPAMATSHHTHHMDPQYAAAAMYANSGGAGTAATADGSAGEGGPAASPGKMGAAGGWGGGHMGGVPMGGMQMGGMVPAGFMPGMQMMSPTGGMMMGPMMGMVPGGFMSSGSSGRNHAKGVCQVEGCNADLRGLRDYHLRYKICEYHLKVSSIIRDGVHQRFCQQCGRFHPLQDFDGAKRSCRARLLRHNARRRKRGEEEMAATNSYGNQPQASAMKRGRGSFSQIPGDMEDPSGAASGSVAAPGGAGANSFWGMMPNMPMDPYMAMAMAYNPDGSYNPAMMGQYAQYGMMSPTGPMMPHPNNNPSDATGSAGGAAAAAAGEEGEAAAGGSSAAAAAGAAPAAAAGAASQGKRGRGGSKGKEGGSEGDWEGEGGEGVGQGDDRAQDKVAWAAAGLEMLADVAQARSSAAGDRSRAGSDAGSKPAEGAAAAAGEKQQQQPAAAAADDGAQQQAGSPKQQQHQGHTGEQQASAEAAAAGGDACNVVPPLQLADSPSPHAAAGGSGGLFVGRVSPGQDAPRTEPGADDAAGAVGSGGAAGKRVATPGASAGVGAAAALAAAAAGDGSDARQRLSAAAGGSSSPSNDLAFRADKPGAAAGTVKG